MYFHSRIFSLYLRELHNGLLMLINRFAASLICLLGVTSAAYAQSDASPVPKVSDEWRFSVTPYLWAPGINGTLYYNNTALGSSNLSSSNILNKLSAAGMITGEAHKGDWGALADFMYVQFNNSNSTTVGQTDLGSNSTLKGSILTGALTYTVVKNPSVYLDGLIGARGLSLTASSNINVAFTRVNAGLTRNPSASTTTTDPIIGLKGRVRIADSSWFVPYYGDIGGGGGTTTTTWQAMAGVGKAFSWGDIALVYRALYYDMHNGGLTQKTTMAGPALGVTFIF